MVKVITECRHCIKEDVCANKQGFEAATQRIRGISCEIANSDVEILLKDFKRMTASISCNSYVNSKIPIMRSK